MAANNLYMPLHWPDYSADTAHLTLIEHGAYLMLIRHYWTTSEPLPDDDKRLARILRIPESEWSAISGIIREFFDARDGLLHHGRIDAELQRACEKSAKAREAANRRHADVKQTQSERNAGAERPQSKGNANQVQDQVKENLPSGDTARKEGTPKKGRAKKAEEPLPADWEPTPQSMEEAGLILGPECANRELARFRNWASGENRRKANWQAAWRNWFTSEIAAKNARMWRENNRGGVNTLTAIATGTYFGGTGNDFADFDFASGHRADDRTGRIAGPVSRSADREGSGEILDLRPSGSESS